MISKTIEASSSILSDVKARVAYPSRHERFLVLKLFLSCGQALATHFRIDLEESPKTTNEMEAGVLFFNSFLGFGISRNKSCRVGDCSSDEGQDAEHVDVETDEHTMT